MKAMELGALDVEIHGYLDGELSKDSEDRVEGYLDQERPAAERLVHYGIQGDLIRRLYGPLLNRPMPKQMAHRLQAITDQQTQAGTEPEPEESQKRRSKTSFVLFLILLLVAGGIAAAFLFEPSLLDRVSVLLEFLSISDPV